MKRILLVFAFFTGALLQSFSQSDFRPGWVILNSSDTLYGSINYRGIKKHFQECEFIENNSTEKVVLLPGDIISYRFLNDKYYVSRYINQGDSGKKILEFLFDGIVDLYYNFDKSGDHYYISKEDSELVELKKTTITEIIDNRTYTTEMREYIDVLKKIFSDSPAIVSKAQSTLLNSNSLIQISEDYHKEVCSTLECIIFARSKIKPKIRFGLFAGYSTSGTEYFSADNISYLELATTGSGMNAGAFVNLTEPSISEKISLQLELSFHKSKFTSQESVLDFSNLKVPFVLKYTFPFKKVQPSVLAGVLYSNVLLFENRSENYGTFDILRGKSQYGVTAGIEVSHRFASEKSLYFQARYEYLTGRHSYLIQEVTQVSILMRLRNLNFTTGILF